MIDGDADALGLADSERLALGEIEGDPLGDGDHLGHSVTAPPGWYSGGGGPNDGLALALILALGLILPDGLIDPDGEIDGE